MGRVLEALSERHFLGVLWDVSRGPAFDLCNRGVVSQLRGIITVGHAQAVIFHLPFGTWQVPLTRPKGPPVIRDIHEAHRCVTDDPITISRINRANRLVRVAVSVADSCRHQQVPFLLLHPAESLAWQLPAIKQLSRVAGATEAVTSYCQWGSPWQKSIRIISLFVDLGDQLAVCQGVDGR